jgi:hypothetical protein
VDSGCFAAKIPCVLVDFALLRFLRRAARPKAKTLRGERALHQACERGHAAAAAALMKLKVLKKT